VRVVYDSEHHFIELSVIDYGIGFDPKKVKKGMGLSNIRERAEMIQAEMVIESIVKKGTRIQVKYLF
jgi:signal transduction histidine kinase